MTFTGKLLRLDETLVSIALAQLSGADGTAAFLTAGAGEYGRFPDVPVAAAPPDLFMAAQRYHLWRQLAVQRIVPLGGGLRLKRRQIVEARQNAPSGAVGAAHAAGRPGSNDRLPFMAQGTTPPDLPVAVSRHLIRRQLTVACRVPFLRQRREHGGQIRLSRHSRPSAANGTAIATAAAADAGPPGVPLFTAPPGVPSAARQHMLRRQRPILLRIPLGGQGGIHGGQIVAADPQDAARAVGAPCAACPDTHLGLPGMTGTAMPPDLLMTAPMDIIRRQRSYRRTVWRKPHSGARRRGGWGFLYVFRLYSFASLRFRTSTAIMPMLTAHRPA